MRYIMPCLLPSPIEDYHREMVRVVAERFGLTFTQRQAIPAHFTVKYHFTTPEIGQVEALLEDFVRKQRRTSIIEEASDTSSKTSSSSRSSSRPRHSMSTRRWSEP
jgi:hypothetical protein